MSWLTQYNLLRAHFVAGWTTSPIAWPGLDFVTPTPNLLNPASSSWVRFSVIKDPKARAITLGTSNTRSRETGILTISIFTPFGVDAGLALGWAALIKPLWHRRVVGEVHFRATSIYEVPRYSWSDPKDPWFNINVSTSFYWDERS